MGAPKTPYKQPYAHRHEKLHGPGDQRPTALQVAQDENVIGKLGSKTILITGCSSGLGVETARALYETGAHLVLTVRDIPKGQAVLDDIVGKAKIQDAPKPELLELHLDSLDGVRKAAEEYKTRFSSLNILICNAGVMLSPYTKTKDGFELQIGTNHMAHFLLFQLLKPLLLESAANSKTTSRVVMLSSAGHRMGTVDFDDMNFEKREYQKWGAYGQSKTANIYMANYISRHYGDKNLHGYSVHPGVIMTELARHMSETDFAAFDIPGWADMLKSPEQGAATTVWAAVAKIFEGDGGIFLEDVGESAPFPADGALEDAGYAPHAYDEESEDKLWKVSCKAVGVPED